MPDVHAPNFEMEPCWISVNLVIGLCFDPMFAINLITYTDPGVAINIILFSLVLPQLHWELWIS